MPERQPGHFFGQLRSLPAVKFGADGRERDAVSRIAISSKRFQIVVGGAYGSMLKMAKFVVPDDVPVIGINRGKLGFLSPFLMYSLMNWRSSYLRFLPVTTRLRSGFCLMLTQIKKRPADVHALGTRF